MQEARRALLVEMQMELPKDDWVDSALADLKYISRMRDLEQQLEEGSFQEKVLDVVPISGLIMGQFVRLENELKTAQELWGGRKGAAAKKSCCDIGVSLSFSFSRSTSCWS